MFRVFPYLLVIGFMLAPVQAEVLIIDAIAEEPSNTSAGLLRPKNGDSMQAVEARFGPPDSTRDPVGEPPISRWDYPSFSVYFEFDKVLTSVVHRTAVNE